jgi:hypothetical protein
MIREAGGRWIVPRNPPAVYRATSPHDNFAICPNNSAPLGFSEEFQKLKSS